MGRFTNLGYCIGMILILQSCSSDQSEQTEAVIPVFYEVNSFLSDEVQPIQTDVRYFSADNFVGEVITGYNAEKILMTLEAALASRSGVAASVSQPALRYHGYVLLFSPLDSKRLWKSLLSCDKATRQHL